ncbi:MULTISPECIES: NapC/NirT family cytochrome c [unclassified Marichromatium]|uniref:cytochrome c3 family protein n=1 Tax=unclassified Marichromatium TaxID=2618417 RepID=UPI000F3ABB4C|nr:NapC/NirT family cytochrome c [Marichromatium sp. AB32]MBO8087346.1 NapC/NirT family cytochrome c [Marichromatium sp.]RNE91362.1 7-cyano-7-deazaguanine reductase [Marichromatium sp. AB32]
MKKRTWLLLGSGGVLLLAGLASGSWMVTETALQATSDREFCSSCHTMDAFVASYDQDVHGGQNPQGLRADCADCHLPHDSPANYFVQKGLFGLKAGWGQVVSLVFEPDWIASLEQRNDFLYDSACLNCHAALEHAPEQSPAAAFGHRTYFAPDNALSCADCHPHVGHKDLRAHLAGDALPTTTNEE